MTYGNPAQYPAAPASTATVRLTIQGNVMSSSLIAPTTTINGYPVPSRYGVQDIPVYAGGVRIALQAQWMRTYGQATLDLTAAPGHIIPVFYAPPWHQFTSGSIGFEKQRRKGLGVMIALLGVPVGIILALLVLAVVVGG
jgi:hypothetical protein